MNYLFSVSYIANMIRRTLIRTILFQKLKPYLIVTSFNQVRCNYNKEHQSVMAFMILVSRLYHNCHLRATILL